MSGDSATLQALTQRTTFAQLDPAVQAKIQAAVTQISSAFARNDLLLASISAVVIYETLHLLPTERQLIWKAPRSISKWLYIWVRYALFSAEIIYCCLFFAKWSLPACEKYGRWLVPIVPFFVIHPAQALLCLRAYSVWGRNKRIIPFLVFPVLSSIGVRVYTITDTSGVAPFIRSHGPCAIQGGNPHGWAIISEAIGFIFFDMVITVLILWKCMPIWRAQKSVSMRSIAEIISKDSLGYLGLTLILYAVNIAYVSTHTGNDGSQGDTAFVTSAGAVLLTLRITLSLRDEDRFAKRLDTITLGTSTTGNKIVHIRPAAPAKAEEVELSPLPRFNA